jgi:rare lipoprotein A
MEKDGKAKIKIKNKRNFNMKYKLLVTLSSLLLLHGCSTSSIKLDKEPLSRYGNIDSYTVFGKKYYTISTSEGYREIGDASWYGKKFHGRLTSNREPYDMYGISAAQKTLPLPSYVKVTNLKNHKELIVRVNDRGPFHGDRIIDLSYGAAKKLDMVEDGVARVKVEAIPPYQYK